MPGKKYRCNSNFWRKVCCWYCCYCCDCCFKYCYCCCCRKIKHEDAQTEGGFGAISFSSVELLKKYPELCMPNINAADSHELALLRLNKIAEMLNSDWPKLAVFLKVQEKDVKKDDDVPENSAKDMLRIWSEIEGVNATGEVLLTALKNLGRTDIISECLKEIVSLNKSTSMSWLSEEKSTQISNTDFIGIGTRLTAVTRPTNISISAPKTYNTTIIEPTRSKPQPKLEDTLSPSSQQRYATNLDEFTQHDDPEEFEDEDSDEYEHTVKKITRIIRVDEDGTRNVSLHEDVYQDNALIEQALLAASPTGTTLEKSPTSTLSKKIVVKKEVVKTTVIKDGHQQTSINVSQEVEQDGRTELGEQEVHNIVNTHLDDSTDLKPI